MRNKKQPTEIFAIRGKEMIEKLKSRRDGLLKNAMKYYLSLQRIAPADTATDYLASGDNRISSPSL